MIQTDQLKIALIEVKPTENHYIAKEMAGGLGRKVKFSNNFLGKVLTRSLNSFFSAPPIVLAQVSGVCKQITSDILAYHTANVDHIPNETNLAIVLSSMVDYHNEVNFIKTLKVKLPEIKVIVVGSFAAAMPEIYQTVADCIITGDPETALNKILRDGLPEQKIIHSERPDNLNKLPMLDWTPFLKNGYYAKRPFSKELGVSIQKSRGCSMTCNYCPYAAFYGKAKQFENDYTLKEIEHYYNKHGIRYFMFRDPNFGENRKDFRIFMEKLINSPFKISWSCEARLDTFEDEYLRLMATAGLKYIITGVESSDPEILKQNLRRAYTKEETFRKINVLEKAGVVVQTNFILGFPGESAQGVRDTIRYAKALNSMFAAFHIYTPQPGTKIFENYRDKFLKIDWEDFTYSNLVWEHDTLSKEFLEHATTSAYSEYYFRPQWILKHGLRLAQIFF